ncbi:RTC4-like domain-containing protein [Hypoxylon argillaceum]|nr:RTC4-like domain-containing protein [Hypoxylon argillaceum]
MAERRSMLLEPRSQPRPPQRIGLTKHFSGGPPLTQVHGKAIQSAPKQKVKASSFGMKGDSDPLYDPITAPPESSDNEAENGPIKQSSPDDGDNSDEEYERSRTADIRATTFNKAASTTASKTQSFKRKTRASPVHGRDGNKPAIDDSSSLAGSKRYAEEEQPKGANQLEKELQAPRQKKKKQPAMKYGAQQKTKRSNVSQSIPSSWKDEPTSSASQDSVPPTSPKISFHRAMSISPLKSQTPRKPFKNGRQSLDLDEPEDSKPSFKSIPRDSLSPMPTPRKRRLKHMSPVDEDAEDIKLKPAKPVAKGSRKIRAPRKLQGKGFKAYKLSPDSRKQDLPERPVFKIPGLEDIDSFDDNVSLDATATSGESQDTSYDHLEVEELQSAIIPRCPMCYEEVDSELFEKHSAHGKMSVKQQTAFCRLHKRRSAEAAGLEKGYPKIDWEALNSRCRAHQSFLRNILEGTQVSHYRKVFKEKVDSGKNRTLLTSQDNLTPGYYGPRGLQVMTGFIMSALSNVIRRRAVEDKLISARSYTGYVQTVLVPELTVRLIMEDMSVTEERARNVLEESVEIGELLHEEARDVIRIGEKEDDSLLET